MLVTQLFPEKIEGKDYDIIRVDLTSSSPNWLNIPKNRITVLDKP